MVETKTLGAEWSKAYVAASADLDKESMLRLQGLVAWPPLTSMYGDLVDDLTLICTLLSKKPMVGYLVARRLRLQEEKTHALLAVLEAKGYIKTVGPHSSGDLRGLAEEGVNAIRELPHASPGPLPAPHAVDVFAAHVPDAAPPVVDTAAVLRQLWRVLNTDITLGGRSEHAIADPKSATSADFETSDVLSQLWRVLNTDIALKRTSDNKLGAVAGASAAAPGVEAESADVMSQLWRVLNTEIEFRRKSHPGADAAADGDTRAEAADRLGQLWRVLNSKIALRQTEKQENAWDAEADTSSEAADRLSQLWRILNAEIVVTLPPQRRQVSLK